MKIALALAASLFAASPAWSATAVSISIGQPNFYGHIDLGGAPPPVLVYREPMVVQHTEVVYEPVYLRVRPGHAEHWAQHCSEYNACGRPVYFVQDDWYSNTYAPGYRERHGQGHAKGRKHGHGKGHND